LSDYIDILKKENILLYKILEKIPEKVIEEYAKVEEDHLLDFIISEMSRLNKLN
jgi:hypothetical protein